MNTPTAYRVCISPRYKPVTLLPNRLAADRVTVEATSTKDAEGHAPAATGASTCLNFPPRLFAMAASARRLARRVRGGRKNGANRSDKAIFSKEDQLCVTSGL